jgi:putative Mg2+ transporter-C (MgtC) family protein
VDVAEWEIAVRLGVACLLGGLLGIERETHGREAGLRTHMLLSLGAAVFALASVTGFDSFLGGEPSNASVDPGRIASYVAAGVGFIGGGAILKQDGHVRGLTTAASLWVAAAIGVACGLGLWLIPVIAVGFALVSLALLRPLSRWIDGRFSR